MIIVTLAGGSMPTYEYRCNQCSHEFETEQKIKDAPLKDCPQCGQPQLQRLISVTAFQLKGGGWGSDLYSAKKDKSERVQKAIDDSKKSESKSESKSENKTEKKTEAA
jgi:putative FmdB family regulatory protein